MKGFEREEDACFFRLSSLVGHHICYGAVKSIRPSSKKKDKQFTSILAELHSLLWQRGKLAMKFFGFFWTCRPQHASTPLRH